MSNKSMEPTANSLFVGSSRFSAVAYLNRYVCTYLPQVDP